VSLSQPICPRCQSALALVHQGEFDNWACSAGHGLGATLDETHGQLQNDEIAQLWSAARSAGPASPVRSCPICERAMVTVDVFFDADEAAEGEPGNGPSLGDEWLDVCVSDQFIWFDAGEFDALPHDLADAQPSAEELAHVATIRSEFGDNIAAGIEARSNDELSEKFVNGIYDRIARRSPAIVRILDRVSPVNAIGASTRTDDEHSRS